LLRCIIAQYRFFRLGEIFPLDENVSQTQNKPLTGKVSDLTVELIRNLAPARAMGSGDAIEFQIPGLTFVP
jgi:hypothetical protein